MSRPKKEVSKEKRYWIRCTPEQYEQIKAWSQEKGVSMGDITIAKLFNINILPAPQEKECTYYVSDKKGEPRPYKLKYKTKKKGILEPSSTE